MEDINFIQRNLNNGNYYLIEEKETSKKIWKRFLRVEPKMHGEIGTHARTYRRYAACRSCEQIFRLGPKGGTADLEKHLCPALGIADDAASRLAVKKLTKNQAEKNRKEEISALVKDMASLVIGQENENIQLQELTRARLARACLAEIPPTIIQFYTDGKSAKDRPLSFYDELQLQLDVLAKRCFEARREAQIESQTPKICPPQNYTVQRLTPPNLHLGLSYSKTDQKIIEITWVPTDVESTLGFDRINLIGRKLSELVHPVDNAEIVRILLRKNTADNSTADAKDFSYPECRVTEPVRHRLKTHQPEYQTVFLTGYVRQCIRSPREKSKHQENEISSFPMDYWPRLAAFLHIYTYYQYMTLHSIDGRIIQADKRITMVAGYTCDEVINKSAHEFIREDALPSVSQAQNNWLQKQGANCISYPLKAKEQGTIVFVKSRGEFVYFRDSATNRLVQGFILNNALIHEEEYFKEVYNSSSGFSSSLESSFEGTPLSSPIAVEQDHSFSAEEQFFLNSTLGSHSFDTSNYSSSEYLDLSSLCPYRQDIHFMQGYK